MRKVLILEPYFGGSHKMFLEGVMDNVHADYTLLTLPARKWKMRMQLSAQWFMEQLSNLGCDERCFDTVICSTFVDVAVFRSLTCRLEGWNNSAKICLYFHENQFAYPNRTKDTSLYHFTSINFNSAMAADSIAFNSEFNRSSFMDGCSRYLKFASDMKLSRIIDDLKGKSVVIYPGIEFSGIDAVASDDTLSAPTIVWNHRWEHDKNPEEFFFALQSLKKQKMQFHLIVLGQSFRQSPDCFERAKEEFSDEIIHFGFAESYERYIEQLVKGTIVVSTSTHEFYGISIIEAVRAGCRPLLPKRLSYPELFPQKYLYEDGDLFPQLKQLVARNKQLEKGTAIELTEQFGWSALTASYNDWLFSHCKKITWPE
ncbi:MAG: glycosyltransferase involved in cell wall biosynthesis [Desulforhopalus sp.]|jgi:glycosyltransferase involved in cell wall biosynthesis